jgi:hypothetical protein
VSHADVQRRSGRDLVDTESRFGDLWWAVKDNPYLLLAAGPVFGWWSSWLLVYVWDYATYSGSIVQYAAALIVTLVFWARGAWLLARRGSQRQDPRKTQSTIGGVKELFVAIRDACGAITPVEAAIETSLTVEESEGMISVLATKGYLEVSVERGRVL